MRARAPARRTPPHTHTRRSTPSGPAARAAGTPDRRREAAAKSDPGGQCGLAHFYEKNKGGIWEEEGLDRPRALRLARDLYQ